MRFNELYRHFDQNMDGVINEHEFSELVRAMGVLGSQQQIQQHQDNGEEVDESMVD